LLALLTGTLMGAVLGFLRYNWAPASIMMGDTGSLFLGYLLAATSIWSVRKSATAVLVVFPVVALGLPLLDTSLTISRRLLAGRPVMQADRDHVHHRLLGHGLPVQKVVLLLYAACAVFSALSLGMVLVERTLARLCLARGGDLCAGPVLRLWLSAAWAQRPVYRAAASATNPAAAAAAAGARTAAASGADPAGARRSGDALCRGDRALAVAAAAVF
jgi:hypothetical protein